MRRALLLLLAVLAAAVLLTVWRLRQGPIPLDPLLQRIEEAVNAGDAAWRVEIERAALEWVDWRHPIGLALYDVRVGLPRSATTVTLPALAVGLSARALLAGTIAPAWVQVRGPSVHVTRGAEGVVEVTLAPGETVTEEFTRDGVIERVLGVLAEASEAKGRFGELETLEIVRGEIRISDAALDRTLRLTGANIDFRRVPEGLSGTLETDVTIEQDQAQLGVTFLYRAREGFADVAIAAADLDTHTLAVLLPPALRDAVDLRLDLSASASGSIGPGGDVRNGRFELQGAAGTIAAPKFWAEPRTVERFHVQGRFDGDGQTLSISDAALDLGGKGDNPLRVTCMASAARAESGETVNAELMVAEFAVPAIGEFWPRGLAEGAREWVTSHVHTGTVRDAVFKLAFASDGGADRKLGLQGLEGRFRYDGLSVSVADALPEAKALAGNAELSATDLAFEIVEGQFGGVQVQEGRVDVTGLGSGRESVEVDVRGVGTSEAVLLFGSTELIDAIGIAGPASGDAASVRARVRVPLPNEGGFDDVDVDASANLGGVHFEHPLLSARMGGEVRLTGKGGRPRVLDVDMALSDPVFSLPLVGTQRAESGYRGHVRFTAYLRDRRVRELRSIDLDGGPVRARGAIRFDEEGKHLAGIEAEELRVGGTRLSGVRTRFEDGLIDVEVGGGIVDASVLTSGPGDGDDEIDASSAFNLRAPRLERVSFGPDRFVENVSLALGRRDGHWKRIQIRGRVPQSLRTGPGRRTDADGREDGNGEFRVDWNRVPTTGGSLEAYVGDAGGALRATALSEGILGGELRVVGTAAADEPLLVRARATGSDFAATSSSIMFRLLGLASGRGILQSPRGDRIPFDEMSADVTFDGQIFNVDRAIARGTVFAVTTSGRVDLREGVVAMRGEIVPAYELTRLLGKIPVVGGILHGDGGVVGVAYGVGGTMEEPALSVDPVGTLTSGLVRRLLGPMRQPGE